MAASLMTQAIDALSLSVRRLTGFHAACQQPRTLLRSIKSHPALLAQGRWPMRNTKTCPSCGGDVPAGAILCVDCGHHFLHGKRLTTETRRLSYTFGFNPTTTIRLVAAGVLFLAGAIFLVVGLMTPAGPERDDSRSLLLTGAILGLLAPVALGSGTRTVVERDPKGRPELRQQFWVAFVPFTRKRYDLRQWEGVYFDYIPGRQEMSDNYQLLLGRRCRAEFASIQTSGNEEFIKDIGDAIKDVSGLPLERM
jgi:hypothetical protein